jgi:hypothetical protein
LDGRPHCTVWECESTRAVRCVCVCVWCVVCVCVCGGAKRTRFVARWKPKFQSSLRRFR